MKTVMEHFRDMREDHDLSQTDIATIIGVSQQYYSQYETGEHELPLRHFITLADYYNVSADYLLNRCKVDDKTGLDMIYLTKDYTAKQLVEDTLSLNEKGRQSVVEYIDLLKLKEKVK